MVEKMELPVSPIRLSMRSLLRLKPTQALGYDLLRRVLTEVPSKFVAVVSLKREHHVPPFILKA